MPRTILLRDHNAYIVYDEWDAKTRKHIYDETPITRLVPYLGNPLEMGRNFLFRDLWALIAEDVSTIEQIFRAPLGGYPLKPWVDESKKPSKEPLVDPTKEGMHSLEFYRSKERSVYSDGTYAYYEYVGFHGLGLSKQEWSKTPNKLGPERYSLSGTALNEILDMKISLNPENIIYMNDIRKLRKQRKGEAAKKWVKRYQSEIDLGVQPYTFYEILFAMFHEISFHGAPEERKEFIEELNTQMEQLDKDKAGGVTKDGRSKKTGKKLWYSSKEVFADLKKRRIKEEAKAKLVAPKLIKRYERLLKKHRDSETLAVKRFYMENKGNDKFRKAAEKLAKPYLNGI